MKRLLGTACLVIAVAACSKTEPAAGGGTASTGSTTTTTAATAPAGFSLKADGKDLTMSVKSGVMRVGEQKVKEVKDSHALYMFTLGSYDLTNGTELSKELTTAGDVRVSFQLLGAPGSGKETPLTPGTFTTETGAPGFDNQMWSIATVADGKQKMAMAQDFPMTDTKGQVKILSVEGDTVKGEIDIKTSTTLAVKGSFTAKIKPIDF